MKQLLFYVLWLQAAAAFQQSYYHYPRSSNRHSQATGAFTSTHDEHCEDAIGRRVFTRNALLTLSILSIKPDDTLAATDDELEQLTTATSSTLEGELIVSSPPPKRKIITDDEETLLSQPDTQVVSKKKAKASTENYSLRLLLLLGTIVSLSVLKRANNTSS